MITATFANTPDIIHEYDITCRRGVTFAAAFTFTGKDFTDYQFKCEVRDLITRRRILSFTPILTSTNVINFNKDASQMVVRAGTYRYDLAIGDPDDISQVDYVKGLFIVTDDVSSNVVIPLEDDDDDVIIT